MDMNRTYRGKWRGAVLAVVLTAGTLTAAAPGAHAEGARTETPVRSTSPVTGVTESMVRVKAPLPESAGPRPAACDWLSYLRYRSADGPAASADADRILIAQPGILEGAGAFDSVARNTVTRAAEQGAHIEFWALDRRSNCLEDRTGIASGNQHTAVDYYYRGKQVGGRTFGGYTGNAQLGWMAKLGIEQTVRDQYDLLTAELPSQALRKRKVLCGGHSLGGVITGYFAAADFDGNRSTTADAGYNQCAGYFALDTTVSTTLGDLSGSIPGDSNLPDIGLGYGVVQAGLDSGVLPRTLSAPVLLNPETMTLLGIAGLGALKDLEGEADLLGYLPRNLNIESTNRFLFAKDTAAFLSGSPAVRTSGSPTARCSGRCSTTTPSRWRSCRPVSASSTADRSPTRASPQPTGATPNRGCTGPRTRPSRTGRTVRCTPGAPTTASATRTTPATGRPTAPRSPVPAKRSPTCGNWPAAWPSSRWTSPSSTSRPSWSRTSSWPPHRR